MEKQSDAEISLFDGSAHWWWAMGSGAQIMWGVRCIRRGYAGDCRLMPVKAFGIASLFVGAIATSSVAFLSASGIHTVQDAIDMGANIRTNLGITPQIPDKQITGGGYFMNTLRAWFYLTEDDQGTDSRPDSYIIRTAFLAVA